MSDIRLKRFLVEDLFVHDGLCLITGGEARHMSKVLRMGRGDGFILLDGKGGCFLAEIRSVSHEGIKVQIKEPLPVFPSSPVEMTLCQAVIKSGPMDYLIQKSSELGVTRICPFVSSRTVVRLTPDKQPRKLKRWREISYNAAKQCNRAVPAEIGAFKTFKEQLLSFENEPGIKVILWEGESSRDLKGLLRSGPLTEFIGMVGPEGGFTSDEMSMAQEIGFIPVSLGLRILRSETAAQTLVAIVQYEWGDLSINEAGSRF